LFIWVKYQTRKCQIFKIRRQRHLYSTRDLIIGGETPGWQSKCHHIDLQCREEGSSLPLPPHTRSYYSTL
jgi:hypothetical protein